MFKAQYFKPSMQSVNLFSFPSLTQYQLTGLTECGSDPCPDFIGNTYTLGFHICAEGISDPSQLNDGAQTTLLDCPGGPSQSDIALSNCRAADSVDITCPAGTLAVTCDSQVLCSQSITNCSFDGFGVTDNGQFVPCPTRA